MAEGPAPGRALAPYLCDLHRSWLVADPARDAGAARCEDGSLLFLDISGFTPLTERLSRHGKAGVEELIETLNGVLGPLVSTAGALGGDTLKFGGDALLLHFAGPGHERRACAAAWDLQDAMRAFRRLRTSAGVVGLSASAGVASGPVHAFLAGDRFRELVVAGPTTSAVMGLEKLAEAGEVLVGPRTAAALDGDALGAAREDGRLLRARPAAPAPISQPSAAAAAASPVAAPAAPSPLGLPAALHGHLGPDAESEHRQVTVAFAQFRGLDELLERAGARTAADELQALMARVQAACERHGVTFLATDADLGAGKVFLVAGAPSASPGDEDRMLRALREIVAHDGALRVRAGANRGRAFAVHLGAAHRRTYTTMGDTTNLAARVMGKAPDGEVLATRAVLDCVRAPFALHALPPFAVKGKRDPVDAALVGEPGARAAANAMPPEAPPEAGILAGRAEELAVLRAAVDAARGGAGHVVELVGDPGIGKSRLLAEMRAHATAGGMRHVVVEAGAYGTLTPYFALRAPLRRLVGAADADDAGVAAALRAAVRAHQPASEPLLPLLAIPFGIELPATEQTASLAEEFRRAELHRALDALLAAMLPAGRTLIAVEDAHWLDEASGELLRVLAAGASARGWAVVVTRRPEPTGLISPSADATRLELAPLGDRAARALVLADAGTPPAPHVTAALVARAEGNPLFLRELLAAARAGADLEELPESVEALLTARIDTLPPADRRLLRRAAVLGQRFPLRWLAGMLDAGERELRDGLARLEDFLALGDDGVRFRHALARDTAYEALPFGRRRELHTRAGELIERELGDARDAKADILALHFLLARDHGRAWPYARRAAEQARDRFAHADAARLYRRALEAARALRLPAGELAAVHEELGLAHTRCGEPDAAMAAFTTARRLAGDDALAQGRLLHRHARVALEAGHTPRAARWALRALRALEPLDGQDAVTCRAEVRSTLAGVRDQQGRAAAAIALGRQAIAEAERTGAERVLAQACYVLDLALVNAGRAAEAVHSERALEIFRRVGDADREAAVLGNLGAFAYWEGRWDDAVALYRHAGEASARAGDLSNAAIGDCNIAEVRSDQGRLEEAASRLTGALEIWRGTGRAWGVAFATALLGRVAARAGRHDEAHDLLHAALDDFRELRSSADALWVEALLPEADLLAGRAEQALAGADHLLQATAGGGRFSALLHRVRGSALVELGDDTRAAVALEAAVSEARAEGEHLELALSLDVLQDVARHAGRIDPRRRRERDAILERLDVVRLPRPAGTRDARTPRAALAGARGSALRRR